MADPKVYAFTTSDHHDTYPAIAKYSHQGRVVLITGASKGIGLVTAISFAKAGAHAIIIAARSNLNEVEKEILAAAATAGTSPQVLKLHLDVTDPKGVAEAAVQVQQKFGKLDILLNNAGYLEKWTEVSESDPMEWWKTWEINLKGTYLMTRAFLPLIQQSDLKTIVNVSSIGAHVTFFGASAYQSSKLAVIRFTEFIAAEYGDKGVVAFVIHPGGVPTELATNMPDHMHGALIDKPELAADTVAWLTQEQQQWLNGRYLSVTWDMPELFARKDEIIEGNKLKVKMVV
ncbi:hypothetical protein UA08_08742 [Talaromyces atroroseus]|uniref:Uncharacterized protein n=1 Tax=Talaromyces atroroseus TaxID=1441469 RepID=A0A225ANY0_TALAT|nr:hypothetical protein UA08_08742 [Talaromyces atroroseus]OKL56135.1 hypothetical protein UA08_08742 [Talaromyces atroroseus]